jgi:hypothetical protein
LGFGSLPLRYREQLLQALTGGNGLLGGIHGGIIADVPEPVSGAATDRRGAKSLRMSCTPPGANDPQSGN